VFVGGLGLHLRNRLDLSLEDEESFVIEVDAAVAEQGRDGGKVGLLAIDVVLARVVLERFAGDDELGVRDDSVAAAGLDVTLVLYQYFLLDLMLT
jgi:hypothetical protein